jgi:hypothetical protein
VRGDACILPGLGFCIPNDFLSNLVEVEKFLPWKMKKFAPFIRVSLLVVGFVRSIR